MNESNWVKTPQGIWTPPSTPEACVEKAEFSVKVRGFAPVPKDKAMHPPTVLEL